MHHFRHLFPELQMVDSAQVNSILALGLSRPYLLDAILAVSASHLRFQSSSKSSHRVAEHFQQALAITNFQGALGEPLDQQTADALLLTAMFLNLLSFSVVEEEDIGSSWVYNRGPESLGWLSLSLGIKPLIYATETFRENTILSWMFDSPYDGSQPFHDSKDLIHLHDVPSHWLDLVGLTRESNAEANLFHAVRILKETDKLEPKSHNFFPYVNFIGSLDAEFREDLERQDETAMWLMGYWLGLLCRYDFWWLRKRVRRDYRAVCLKLQAKGVRDRPGEEGVMWRKLMDDLDMAPDWGGREHERLAV
jgi:hypothetical protein